MIIQTRHKIKTHVSYKGSPALVNRVEVDIRPNATTIIYQLELPDGKITWAGESDVKQLEHLFNLN